MPRGPQLAVEVGGIVGEGEALELVVGLGQQNRGVGREGGEGLLDGGRGEAQVVDGWGPGFEHGLGFDGLDDGGVHRIPGLLARLDSWHPARRASGRQDGA